MILQLHLTDAQLTALLNEIGYKTEMVDVPGWRKEYHNRLEPYMIPRLHVVLSDGSKKPAKEFFETIIDEAIIDIIKNNKNGKS